MDEMNNLEKQQAEDIRKNTAEALRVNIKSSSDAAKETKVLTTKELLAVGWIILQLAIDAAILWCDKRGDGDTLRPWLEPALDLCSDKKDKDPITQIYMIGKDDPKVRDEGRAELTGRALRNKQFLMLRVLQIIIHCACDVVFNRLNGLGKKPDINIKQAEAQLHREEEMEGPMVDIHRVDLETLIRQKEIADADETIIHREMMYGELAGLSRDELLKGLGLRIWTPMNYIIVRWGMQVPDPSNPKIYIPRTLAVYSKNTGKVDASGNPVYEDIIDPYEALDHLETAAEEETEIAKNISANAAAQMGM